MDDVLAIILGGGRGTRLFPLTLKRSKPAVPIGGKYRLIDIPISNCLNADLRHIFVLTQFNSESLNKHVAHHLQVRPVLVGASSACWPPSRPRRAATGSRAPPTPCARACATCERTPARDILILSGDQLYQHGLPADAGDPPPAAGRRHGGGHPRAPRIRPRRSASSRWTSRAASCTSTRSRRASGCPGWSPSCRAAGPATWPRWASTSSSASPASRPVANPQLVDFGRHVIPDAGARGSACRPTSIAATGRTSGPSSPTSRPTSRCADPIPPFDFYDAERPVYTHPRFLPATKSRAAPSRARWSPRAASCTAPRSSAPSSASAAASARASRSATACSWAPTTTRRWRRCSAAAGARPAADRHRRRHRHRATRSSTRTRASAAGVRIVNEAGVKEHDGDGYFIREGIVIVPKNGCHPERDRHLRYFPLPAGRGLG